MSIAVTCAFGAPQSQVDGSQPVVSGVKVEAPKAPVGAVAEAGVVAVPRSYVLGIEDIILVRVWREDAFSGAHVVRPDGKITIPLLGDVQAEGLTPERLSAQLTEGLSEFISQPLVTVNLNQVNSKKYTIYGQVNRSGQFPMVTPVKIFEALTAAGGFRDFANTKKIMIIRGDKRIPFNYRDVLAGKKLEQNIFLEPGDIINVP